MDPTKNLSQEPMMDPNAGGDSLGQTLTENKITNKLFFYLHSGLNFWLFS